MNEFRADLHLHSHFSDGTLSPIEILHAAKEAGLKGLSITDHDTIKAYTPEFFEEAQRLEIVILTGVEFSAFFGEESVHILGYTFDLTSEALKELCAEHTRKRFARNRAILKRLKTLGIALEESEIEWKGESYGRPHIAAQLIKKGVVADMKEAFDLYLGEGKKAYVTSDRTSVERTLETIHKARGKAFIAHPQLGKKSALRKLLKMPFDGLECYYGRFTRAQVKPYLQMAKHHHLLVSGGSDFHGSNKPHASLGSSYVGEELFYRIGRSG
jgi:predicted metal-dependent phosphoesterase TrpH